MIRFSPQVLHDLGVALQKEWLETNGLGSYASSTIIGVNTRRYHGLLIASLQPPVDRVLLLAKLEEAIILNDQAHPLSANLYPGVVYPTGHLSQTEFALEPLPTFRYEIRGCRIEKRVFMVHGQNTTVIQYRLLEAPEAVPFEVRPLITCRDHHGTTRADPNMDLSGQVSEDGVSFTPYAGGPTLHLQHPGGWFLAAPCWYYNFEHPAEAQRGLDAFEDLANPGLIQWTLSPGSSATVIASANRPSAVDPDVAAEAEVHRRVALGWEAQPADPLAGPLRVAADAFLVKRAVENLTTVIAGYPWFTDWGRDTMIALPGLTLVTGRLREAREILATFARHCSQGMIPNRFPDSGGEPEYNTMDATLWFVQAVRRYVEYSGDLDFVRQDLMPVLTDIVDWHLAGTRFGIRMDDDFLLEGGAEGSQLTWMDAKVVDWVVTPRRGKPVEINALWYAALHTVADLREALEGNESRYRELARGVQRTFYPTFWNEAAGCLFDCVSESGRDPAIRPNQVLAVSLADDLLPRARAKQVVEVARDHLLTPYGLRSLSPSDPNYVPYYGGDQATRDGAYHQGTVWAWLLGPFVTAWVKVHEGTAEARAQAREFLAAFPDHLEDAGLGSVSEIFDGAPPHHPRGCIAQAWSVAEVLRAYHEDILGQEPAFPLGRDRAG
jgi:predicted glycogen debranching enzyme